MRSRPRKQPMRNPGNIDEWYRLLDTCITNAGAKAAVGEPLEGVAHRVVESINLMWLSPELFRYVTKQTYDGHVAAALSDLLSGNFEVTSYDAWLREARDHVNQVGNVAEQVNWDYIWAENLRIENTANWIGPHDRHFIYVAGKS